MKAGCLSHSANWKALAFRRQEVFEDFLPLVPCATSEPLPGPEEFHEKSLQCPGRPLCVWRRVERGLGQKGIET